MKNKRNTYQKHKIITNNENKLKMKNEEINEKRGKRIKSM